MKKVLFAAIAAMTLLFSACGPKDVTNVDLNTLDNTINKCWKIVYTYSGISAASYVWCTERECVWTLQESQKLVTIGKYTYEAAAASDEEACYKLDDDK